jgi:hypothetical protein
MRRPFMVAHGETLIRGTLPAGNLLLRTPHFDTAAICLYQLFEGPIRVSLVEVLVPAELARTCRLQAAFAVHMPIAMQEMTPRIYDLPSTYPFHPRPNDFYDLHALLWGPHQNNATNKLK